MEQQKNDSQQGKRPLTWRMIVYLLGIVLVGHSMGLILYPYLKSPAVVAYLLGVVGTLLIALTAPMLRR